MTGRPRLAAVFLGAGGLVMAVPFADLLLGALRSPAERLARPPVYLPTHPMWENFTHAMTDLPLPLWIGNSLIVTLCITACQLLTSAMAGYALAKFDFPGRAAITRFVVAAQLFPFFLLVIPLFFLLRYVPFAGGNGLIGGGTGLLGTYAALILPFVLSWYGIFMMRQFAVGLPSEILDAARMDGAGELRIFFVIVLPLLRPALATLGVFVFIYHWNEVVWTLTVTRSAPDLMTAPIGVYLMRSASENPANLALQQAALVVTVVPVVAMFVALQRLLAAQEARAGVRQPADREALPAGIRRARPAAVATPAPP